MTVLVLSATGTTGQHTVRSLVARGVPVRAASRTPERAELPEGAEAVRFDFDDPTTWPAAFAGVTAVAFTLPPFRDDEVPLATALLAAAEAAGVKRVVKLSAIGVENLPQFAHRHVELLIEASGLEWITLRPSFFMDNFIHFYGHPIQTDGVIPLPAGKGATAFVAASDIGEVAAVALISDATGEYWPITGDEALDHDQVAAVLSDVLGRSIRYLDIDPQQHIDGMKAMGMPRLGVEVMSTLYGVVREGWAADTVPTVRERLGRPAVRFADWAAAHGDAWR